MKIALFIATGYEEGEVIIIGDLLRRAGISVDLITINDQPLVTSVNNLKALPKLKQWLLQVYKEQKRQHILSSIIHYH